MTPSTDVRAAVESSWHRFLDLYEPLRPELFRYCRYLTRTPWDAEDLSQDALARAFVTLGCMNEPPPNPRAWLFRVASNLWIDRTRRVREEPVEAPEEGAAHEPRAAREAAGTLIAALSPQERAAVVLKDVFDFSLEEIAEALSTTVGAVKAALHRGRGKLVEPETSLARTPAPAALDAFCEAFNARDMDRLTDLLLDKAEIEVVGVHAEYGPEAARKGVFQGMLYGSKRLAEGTGLDPRFQQGALPTSPRAELRAHRGDWLVLLWYAHADGEFVRGLVRAQTDGDRLSRVQNYFYTPEFIADVCRELSVPFRINGYRYWRLPGDER
ncbi:MAG TPA: RNA polymerase sigma factor [Myxococcales bacterium]|nr:RNA polymerase sigma factor [Myxococcales bacterium]